MGFCAERIAHGVPCKRSDPSKLDQGVAWIFEAIGKSELSGVHDLGGGARGDEIDRSDSNIESPVRVKVLASGTGHSDKFGIVPEDVMLVRHRTQSR